MGTSDVATNSTTLVAMPDMAATVTVTTGKALVAFAATVSHDRTQRDSTYALFVDGTRYFASGITSQTADDYMNPSFTYLVTGLSSGSHSFEVRWSISNSDGSVRQKAATWNMSRSLVVVAVN